jgi:hypothetical protein
MKSSYFPRGWKLGYALFSFKWDLSRLWSVFVLSKCHLCGHKIPSKTETIGAEHAERCPMRIAQTMIDKAYFKIKEDSK